MSRDKLRGSYELLRQNLHVGLLKMFYQLMINYDDVLKLIL